MQQKQYKLNCECKGTGRIYRDIGHRGRIAIFVCFACTSDDVNDDTNWQDKRDAEAGPVNHDN